MEQDTLIQEKQHLSETKKKIQASKIKLEKSMESLGSENLQKLKEMRESRDTQLYDFVLFLERLHEQNEAFNFKDKYQRVEEMNTLLNEPYFARLIMEDTKANSKNDIYIGKFSFTDGNNPVVTDWRAKIASVYYRYRYPQKGVKYETPDGTEVRDLKLKRTFEIDKGELIKYYNNDIQLDENEIIVDKINKRTGGVLEDIIETIQMGQLDIIESDPRQICIVQGSVGSGKSTVAIHKLSHIFFNYPSIIHPERAILIAKNQILVGYLSTLFPKLGIFDINYKTLRDVVVNLVFREEMNITIDLDKNTKTSEFKTIEIEQLEKQFEKIHSEYKQRITDLLETEEFVTFGGFVYNDKIPVMENIRELSSDLEEELETQQENLKENPNSVKSWLFKENVKTLKKLLNQIRKIREDVKNRTLPQFVKSVQIDTTEKLGYLEALKYTYIYSELIGLNKWIKFEYCVVDEGQDFSVLEYLILGKIVMNGRFCILGDLNQSYREEGLTSWNEISQVIKDAKKANVFELDTNYRSTKPIIEFANKILGKYTNKYLPKSINRIGKEPEVVKSENFEQMMLSFENQIKEDSKNLNKSVGVICYTSQSLEHAEKILDNLKLPADTIIKLDSKKAINYIPQGIYLSSFENCKGLEFSKVYVIDLNLDTIDNFNEAKKAFVSVTRAMNELVVLSNETKS